MTGDTGRPDEAFDHDRACTRCGGRMVASSTWTATDPDRSWQAVIRYCCEGCAVEGVVTIGRDRPNVYGGFVGEERYDAEAKPEEAETKQTKLVTDGGHPSSDIDREQVRRTRDRVSEEDDETILYYVTEELNWCEKETRYVVGGSSHPHAEERIGRIRQRLHEIDAMLGVVEDRSTDVEPDVEKERHPNDGLAYLAFVAFALLLGWHGEIGYTITLLVLVGILYWDREIRSPESDSERGESNR